MAGRAVVFSLVSMFFRVRSWGAPGGLCGFFICAPALPDVPIDERSCGDHSGRCLDLLSYDTVFVLHLGRQLHSRLQILCGLTEFSGRVYVSNDITPGSLPLPIRIGS